MIGEPSRESNPGLPYKSQTCQPLGHAPPPIQKHANNCQAGGVRGEAFPRSRGGTLMPMGRPGSLNIKVLTRSAPCRLHAKSPDEYDKNLHMSNSRTCLPVLSRWTNSFQNRFYGVILRRQVTCPAKICYYSLDW
jgi:hypothetical protein